MSSTADPEATQPRKGKAYTPPKGRATVHNTGQRSSRRMSPTMEWLLAAIIFVLVLAAIFYFGSDFRSGGGGGAQSGAPAFVEAVAGTFPG